MQNYGQAQGYPRPGGNYPAQGYGAPQGYQSAAPQAPNQWSAPNPPQTTAQWNQPPQQQAGGGYNPGTYGVMPGGYAQGQQQQPHNPQPPPPPPKPVGFAGAVQSQQQHQGAQAWGHQPQQNTTYTSPQQGGYPVQGGQQQQYNQAPAQPPSVPPGGSYYSSPQGGQPGSNYAASPIANPSPGAYGPPHPTPPAAPGAPTWQQGQPVQHGQQGQHQAGVAQGFAHPKPATQGYQGNQPQQPYGQPAHSQYAPQGQPSQQVPVTQNQFSHQQPYGQTAQPQGQYQQSPQQAQYNSPPPTQHAQQPPPYSQQHGQWQSPAPTASGYGQPQNAQAATASHQQPQWQPGHHSQGSLPGQQSSQGSYQGVQAPKPLSRTDTVSSNFFNQSSPQSQPVSPVGNRQSVSFSPSAQTGLGRTGSVSSVALANLQAQRTDTRTESPKPASVKLPTPPPPRDDKSKFSALGTGGPSDWEHFGADDEVDDTELFAKHDEKKNEPAQLDSVELPAQVPPTQSTQGFPSHPAPHHQNTNRDSYVPTPPPNTASPAGRPPSQPPQHSFVMGDAAVAPLRTSPRPTQASQPPHGQQNFVRDSGAISAHSTPVQGQWATPSSNDHSAELKGKEEELNRLRAESEKIKADLQAEIEKLRAESENAKQHAVEETRSLHEQIAALNSATTQAKSDAEGMVKEKDMMIERLKEDVEGKEHNIEERDTQIADLKRQLEAEQKKETVKPTAADLIPDINPWYVNSLERYIEMLRGEESEPEVENKKNIFKSFLKAESAIRFIDYYDAPPPAPAHDTTKSPEPEQSNVSRSAPENPAHKPDLSVRVPEETLTEDDYEISPGGRPVFRPKGALPPKSAPAQQHFQQAEQPVPAPIAAAPRDDVPDSAPAQAPEEPTTAQYRAYVPPAGNPEAEPTSPVHRQSTSFGSFLPASNTPGSNKSRDEIFFGAHEPEAPSAAEKPPSIDRSAVDTAVPPPLSLSANRPTSVAPPPKVVSASSLADLLPSSIKPAGPNQSIEKLRSRVAAIKPGQSNLEELTKTWEKSASVIRRKNDSARRARLEDIEDRNEELFNNNELSYAEISAWEAGEKEKEAESKAKEDRDEYKSYVEAVFDPVYDGLQADIKSLMDFYIEGESILPISVAGLKSLQNSDAPSTQDCLELLTEMHAQLEARHDKVVHTVAERDKRYKKTEIQPLYAAGNIAKMKKVEKHFEGAEKQAVLRAKREKGERVGELVNMAEEIVVGAVGVEQGEIDRILDAIKAIEDDKGDTELLARAQTVLTSLKTSSKTLLELFNKLEIELNDAVLDAEIAEARASTADAAKIKELEDEKVAGAKKMTDEYERRVTVLNQDNAEIEALIKHKSGGAGGKVELTEEQEKERRLKQALEDAKRRNGHI